MSEITLNTVRLYTTDDPYEVNTDNRPLVDIMSNVDLINNSLGNFGFYIEALADPANTPVGGFTLNTCACIMNNGLLEPIDITLSAAEVDYQNYPLVLVVDYNPTTALYGCLTFSASYSINSKFPPFLTTSIGNPVMVGLGGVLVDSYFFNQFYSGSAYQNLVVGRISSVSTMTFGGNQVSVLGDNYFVAKNRDDSTTGLTTVTRNDATSNVVFKSVSVDTVGCPYVFAEFQNAYIPQNFLTQLATPVFFTNNSINYNQSSGTFLDTNLNSKLNEIHFAAPTLSPSNAQDSIYNSAGINIASLTTFTDQFLLHSAAYSNALTETSQTISSTLQFAFQPVPVDTTQTQTVLAAQFPSITRSIGTGINQNTGIPNALLPTTDTSISGVTFDNYQGVGSYIGTILDNPTGITRPTALQDESLAQSTNFSTVNMSDLAGSCTLLINANSDDTTVLSNIVVSANGYVVLSGDYGVHYSPLATIDSEIANKAYVDSQVATVTNASTQVVPLTGTSATAPISGMLYSDISQSTSSQCQVLQFNTVGTTDILSSNTIRLIDSSATPSSTGLMLLNLNTSAALTVSDAGWNNYEAVNKAFLSTYVTSVLSGGAASTYVSKSGGAQTITSGLSITSGLILSNGTPGTTSALAGGDLYLNSPLATIITDGPIITFAPSDSALAASSTSVADVKLQTGSTVSADPNSTLTTKDYVDASIANLAAYTPDTWAAWAYTTQASGGMIANAPPTNFGGNFNTFLAAVSGIFHVVKSCTIQVKLSAYVISSDYLIDLGLFQGGSKVAGTGCGNTTTAAGISSGNYSMDIDVILNLATGDTLNFAILASQAVKTSGVLTTFNTSGYMKILTTSIPTASQI